jgi:biopolymer transport protein ExbD
MKFNTKIPEPLGFQLTPMLDVVFILLIFFVVTQKFILNEQDLAVEVPTAAGNETESARAIEEIILNAREVLADEPDAELKKRDMEMGRKPGDLVITINRQEYSVDELSVPLRNQVVNQPDLPVCIRADKDMRWEKVVRVVEACTSAGVYNIRFKKVMPGESTNQQTKGVATPAPSPAQ